MKKYEKYLITIIITMGSQALIYFLIKNFINDYNIINSFIDIPLVKPFVYFYDSWYPFIILSTFLVYKYDRINYKYLIASMILSTFMAHVTFIIYPSMVIRPTIDVNNLTDWLLDFTYKTDTPAVNCLPSVHAIYCFVTSYFILKSKEIKNSKKIIFGLFSFLIVLSTVFVKQHVIEDVILSLIYTIIVLLIVYFNKRYVNKLSGHFNNLLF